jgi:choline monooxygenase
VSESLRRGATLPAAWYTTDAVFRREQQAIFSRYWQYVCRTDEVPRPGDYVARRAGPVPVVVVRDQNGQLKAFINVCRHRGAEVVLDGSCGNRSTLQCHYHAWTWDFDGRLRAAPGSDGDAGFRPEDYPLTAAGVAVLGQFVFVKPDPHAPGWVETAGALAQALAACPIPVAALAFRERRTYDMKANWKIVVENFLECYHCAVAHKGFANLIDLKEYTVTPYRYSSTQRGPLKAAAAGRQDAACFATDDGGQVGLYNFLWPNFMVNLYPGRANASTNVILPVAPDRTLAVYDFYYADAVAEAPAMTAFIDQVQQEDIVICESVQRGLASGHFDRGRLMLAFENGIGHFQRLVFDALTHDEPHPA